VRATPSSSVYFSAASLPSSSPARSAAGRQTEKRAKRSAAGEAQRRIVQLRHAEEEAAIKSPRRASPVKSSALQRWDDDEELVRRMGGASLSSELSSPPPSSCPLAPSSPFAGPSAKLKEPSSTLSDLLRLCGQPRAADFSTLVSTLARPARGRGRPKTTADPRWRKVGEASYSEVFARGDKVVKIVPLRLASAAAAAAHAAEHDAEWPEESSVQDVGREIEIMRALHGIEGFVELER
jgi:serine/threonine-protein kinase haspin